MQFVVHSIENNLFSFSYERQQLTIETQWPTLAIYFTITLRFHTEIDHGIRFIPIRRWRKKNEKRKKKIRKPNTCQHRLWPCIRCCAAVH